MPRSRSTIRVSEESQDESGELSVYAEIASSPALTDDSLTGACQEMEIGSHRTCIAPPEQWPFSAGVMAERIRAFDWASTPLGPIEIWPSFLRCAVDVMLGCAFPTTVQWGPELCLLYNDAYIPLIGPRHPSALGKPILEAFPEIASTYEPLVEKVWQGEQICLTDQPFQYTRENHLQDFWFDLSYSPIHDDVGSVAGILAIGLESTARVLAERGRLVADKRLRRVLETDAIGVMFLDSSGTIFDANDVFLRMVGYSREELQTGTVTWRTLTPPEWIPISEEQMAKVARTGRLGPYEKEYLVKGGGRRWMLFAGSDLGDGTIAEYAIDISDRKRAEAGIHAMEERFRALVEATSDMVYRMSPDWTELRPLRGRDFLSDTEPGQSWLRRFILPEDQEDVRRAIEDAVRNQRPFELEHRVLRADGEVGWTFSRAIPLIDKHGCITEWFGTASDITARKRAEEALVRNEKLATLGRLAASIAHEINNPLEATTNLIFLARIAAERSEDPSQFLEAAEAELKRIAHITRQSLGFYRESSMPLEISVTALIEDSIELLRGKIATKSVRIHRHWREDVRVTAVPGELRQIFSNLVANAVDALEPGGAITIRVSKRKILDKPQVRITFADSGCGIEPSRRSKVFDPFYSTKGNLGTGLGLWVTRQIVEKHRGTIRMKSRSRLPRTGTVFSITFPV